MNAQKALEQLGYNPNEVKVYIAALRLGECSVAELSRKTELPHSTTQTVVDDLQNKGLLDMYIKNKRKVWVPENPNAFLAELKERETVLQGVLPELQSIRNAQQKSVSIKHFEGNSKIQHIFNEIILSNHPLKMMGSFSNIANYVDEDAVTDFLNQMFDKKIHIEFLTHKSKFIDSLNLGSRNHTKHVRYLGSLKSMKVMYFIFDTRLAIIIPNDKESVGVVFEDKNMVIATSLLFDTLWDSAK